MTGDHRLNAIKNVLARQLPHDSYLTIFNVTLPGDLFSLDFHEHEIRPYANCDSTVNTPGVLNDDLNPESPEWSGAMAYVAEFYLLFSKSQTPVLISLPHVRLLWLGLLYKYLPSLLGRSLFPKSPATLVQMTRISLGGGKKSADTMHADILFVVIIFFSLVEKAYNQRTCETSVTAMGYYLMKSTLTENAKHSATILSVLATSQWTIQNTTPPLKQGAFPNYTKSFRILPEMRNSNSNDFNGLDAGGKIIFYETPAEFNSQGEKIFQQIYQSRDGLVFDLKQLFWFWLYYSSQQLSSRNFWKNLIKNSFPLDLIEGKLFDEKCVFFLVQTSKICLFC